MRGFQVFVVQDVIDLIKNKKFQFKHITLPVQIKDSADLEDTTEKKRRNENIRQPLNVEGSRDTGNSEEVLISSNSSEMVSY